MVKPTKKKESSKKPAPMAVPAAKASRGGAAPTAVGRAANLGAFLHPVKNK